MNNTIESDWITSAGLRAVVIMNHGSGGFHCGYVGVPQNHPLFGADYMDKCPTLGNRAPEDVLDAHGGITYADGLPDYPVASDLWWFGFDCGHYGDASIGPHALPGGTFRDLDYCRAQCESLAKQLMAVAGREDDE